MASWVLPSYQLQRRSGKYSRPWRPSSMAYWEPMRWPPRSAPIAAVWLKFIVLPQRPGHGVPLRLELLEQLAAAEAAPVVVARVPDLRLLEGQDQLGLLDGVKVAAKCRRESPRFPPALWESPRFPRILSLAEWLSLPGDGINSPTQPPRGTRGSSPHVAHASAQPDQFDPHARRGTGE